MCPAVVKTAGHGPHTNGSKEMAKLGNEQRTMRGGSVAEVNFLLHQLADRGGEVIASIDHAVGARRAGQKLISGNSSTSCSTPTAKYDFHPDESSQGKS